MMQLIRTVLGAILRLVNRLTLPKPMQRPADAQAMVEAETAKLALYEFPGCPFCIKVQRVAHRLNLPIESRNASRGAPYRAELEAEGGKSQVPCLRIQDNNTVTWLYESKAIIHYLTERFG